MKLYSGVRAESLGKRYDKAPDGVWALRSVDLDVPAGRVLGVLGHNGAGKTTMLRILTTLARPSTGRAWVAGHDVVADPARVRACIGLAGQYATVDGLLTARANLELVGRLYHLSRGDARRRADELLARVALTDVADTRVDRFSGGMRRRLDLAAALVAEPPVLFLDEPTTGLDPHARNDLWALLREHIARGATLVLTTQYLDEADRLCDDIVVLDHGTVVARGTPAALKTQVGGQRFVVTLARPEQLVAARAALAAFAEHDVTEEADPVRLVVPVGPATRLVQVVRALDAAGIDATDVHRREATLDDVFLVLTRGAHRAGVAA